MILGWFYVSVPNPEYLDSLITIAMPEESTELEKLQDCKPFLNQIQRLHIQYLIMHVLGTFACLI